MSEPISIDDPASGRPEVPWAGAGGEIERRIDEMTYEVAAAALAPVISPSLADFIA
jgi:hypothetical protein